MSQFHFNLDNHSQFCLHTSSSWQNYTNRQLCELNKKEVVIFVRNQFVLITYNCCISSSEHEFVQEIVEAIHENNKTKKLIEVSRSVHINEDFKNNRLRGVKFKNYSEEVHYIYSSVSQTYAVTSQMEYVEYFTNRYDLFEKYKQLLLYIDDEKNLIKNKSYLKQCAKELYFNNYIVEPSPIETVKTVNNLIKTIKQKL